MSDNITTKDITYFGDTKMTTYKLEDGDGDISVYYTLNDGSEMSYHSTINGSGFWINVNKIGLNVKYNCFQPKIIDFYNLLNNKEKNKCKLIMCDEDKKCGSKFCSRFCEDIYYLVVQICFEYFPELIAINRDLYESSKHMNPN